MYRKSSTLESNDDTHLTEGQWAILLWTTSRRIDGRYQGGHKSNSVTDIVGQLVEIDMLPWIAIAGSEAPRVEDESSITKLCKALRDIAIVLL